MSESLWANVKQSDGKMPLQSKMRFGFVIFLALLFAYTAWESLSFQRLAQFLPLSVSVIALVVTLIGLYIDIMAYRRTGMVAGDDVPTTSSLSGAEGKELALGLEAEGTRLSKADMDGLGLKDLADERVSDIEPPMQILKRAGVVFGWMMGYIVGIAIIGLMAATAAYLIGYLRFQARSGWKGQFLGTAAILVGLTVMRIMLNLEWPDYVLEDTVRSILGWD